MKKIQELDGTWMLRCIRSGKGIWAIEKGAEYPATVPGSVLSALYDNHVIGDPYYRMQEEDARDLLHGDYLYYRHFDWASEGEEVVSLVFDGVDTVAEILLNNHRLGLTSNMHRTYRYDCKEYLREGKNKIEVRLTSPYEAIRRHTPEEGKEIQVIPCNGTAGNQYLRKAHSMFGWDWGPQLPDMGIWRSVRLESYRGGILGDLQVLQEHRDGKVVLKATSKVMLGDRQVAEKLPAGMAVLFFLESPDAKTYTFDEKGCLTIEQPQLWWPNGYGNQPLYRLSAVLKQGDRMIDHQEKLIGLRELTVSRQKDEWGEEFALKVNGLKIFAMGANYIPEDAIYSRVEHKDIAYLLRRAAEDGMNCIRVWGGGYYPSDYFFDCCDRLGLIVWQDFMFACNVYELSDAFREEITAEFRDNIRRIRHHACLGLWCGNNEMETAWVHWGWAKNHSKALQEDYLEMFERLIPQVLSEEDPQTYYWPSSPSSGGGFDAPDDDSRGDRHYWDVWHGQKPFSDYQKHYFRFLSEFGFQSFPCMDTIRTYTLPEDRNIFSEVMESHQKNDLANAKILSYLAENFRYPKDLTNLVYVSQILQGLAIKSGVEHFRRHRGRCMGTIYWQLNDNWPVASWASIDYYGRYKALQYMVRHFFARRLGSICKEGTSVTYYVQNETASRLGCEIHSYLKDLQGQIVDQWKNTLVTEPYSVSHTATMEMQPLLAGRERQLYLEVEYCYEDGSRQFQYETFVPFKYMQLEPATIQKAIRKVDGHYEITLQADTFAPFACIEIPGCYAVLSDNYMHLTADRRITVVTEDQGVLPEELPEVVVVVLQDSYE